MSIKGIVTNVTEQQKKDKSGTYLRVNMSVNGQVSQYLVSDPATVAYVKANEGKEIELDTFQSKDKTANFLSLPGSKGSGGGGGQKKGYTGSGFQPSRDASFAAAYAKDVAVCLTNMGRVKDSAEMETTIRHFYDVFMELLKKE